MNRRSMSHMLIIMVTVPTVLICKLSAGVLKCHRYQKIRHLNLVGLFATEKTSSKIDIIVHNFA